MKLHLFVVLLVIVTTTLKSYAVEKVIYGNDDRYDMYSYPDPTFINMALATAAQIDNTNLTYDKERGGYVLSFQPLKYQRGF